MERREDVGSPEKVVGEGLGVREGKTEVRERMWWKIMGFEESG